MTRLFFLHPENKGKISKIKEIKELRKGDSIVYLGISFQSEEEKKNSLEHRYMAGIEEETRQARFTFNMAWAQEWAFRKIGGKKSFAEELAYEGKSLWYPAEYFIHFDESVLGSEPSVSRLLIYIDCIKNILNEKKPELVYVENTKSCFNSLVTSICKKERITVKELGLKEKKRSLYQALSDNPLLARTYIFGRVLLRFLIGKLFCKKLGRADVLVLTSDRLSNKDNATDYYWGSLVREMNKRGVSHKLVEYDRIYSLDSTRKIRKRYVPQKYDAQFIGTYYDFKTLARKRKMASFLRKKFRELDKGYEFRKSFNYKSVEFYDLIRPRLKKTFLAYSTYIADIYAGSKSIVEKEKPKIILIDHEKNYYGRALLSEANSKGIPSFAFEGELIFDNNTCLTQVPIKKILDRKSDLWRPIADKKLLWSEYALKWYKEKNYFPESILKIIGAPKYDFIKELNDKDMADIKSKYGAAKGIKLITVVTPDLPWEKAYVTSIFQSLKAMTNIKDIKVVLKLHPNETILNKNMMESLARKFQLNAEVVMEENSSKLIYASDLVITYGSTLTYECILMNKNTVLINPAYKIKDPYVKEGLLKQCLSDAELKKEIQSCLGENKKTMNQAMRKRFIEKYLYSDDGKASERAVDEIMKVLNTKSNTKN